MGVNRFGFNNGHSAPAVQSRGKVVSFRPAKAKPAKREAYLLTGFYDARLAYTDLPAKVEWEKVAQFAHYLHKRGKFSRAHVVKYSNVGAVAYNRIIAHMQKKGYATKLPNNHMKLERSGALWLDVFLREYHQQKAWDDPPLLAPPL